VAAVAKKLGITPATLHSDLQSGQTVAQIAQHQHVALDGTNGLNAAYLAAVKQQLDHAVANKQITQAVSSSLYQMVQQGVQSGRYILLQGGPLGHGPRGNGANSQQPSSTTQS
jgi:DNA helicase TIP49 (TBP-interacting protein)